MIVKAESIGFLTKFAEQLEALEKIQKTIKRLQFDETVSITAIYYPKNTWENKDDNTVRVSASIARGWINGEIQRVKQAMRNLGVSFPDDDPTEE